MKRYDRFEAAGQAAATRLGATQLRSLADRVAAGWPPTAAMPAIPEYADAAAELLAAQRAAGLRDAEAGAYLRGLAAGRAWQQAAVQVESVWSGPSTHHVPVRATAQVLLGLIGEATSELLLVTYSAKPFPPMLEALAAAAARDVSVTVVVETLQGAGSALAGAEPAAAFATVPGLSVWHWPVSQRGEDGAKMHAKVAIADRRLLLVSSANLTQSGATKNIEAGLVVRGGAAPRRAAEHLAALQAEGVLAPLTTGERR